MKNKFLPILIISTLLLSSCGVLFDAADTDESAAVDTEAEAAAEEEVVDEAAAADETAADSETADANTDTTTEEDSEAPYTSAENPCLTFSVLGVSLTTPYEGLPAVTEDDYVGRPRRCDYNFYRI